MARAMLHAGFTLVELILTVTLITGGLFGLLTVFDAANRGAVIDQVYQAAVYLSQERLERITADKWSRGYGYVTAGNYPASENVMLGTHQYTRLVAVQEVSGSDFTTVQAGSGYKRVDVTVAWGVGAANQLVLSTVLGNY